ncbi:hypothetical protein [Streptomyces sp. NPDC058612]|uniref:hypothetical protein n=1 Tax=Streptomyces sp. NPDC058612 TaxID=3346555 RepID=UPI0036623BBD
MEHEQTIPELRKADESAPKPDGSDPAAAPAAGTTPAAAEAADTATADAAAAADTATTDAAADDGAAVAAAPRGRRGRTTLLIAAAAALGVLAGAVAGYAVQYHRDPTPLPPLAQQNLVAPKALAPDDSTTNKTINANRWRVSDGDLVEMLVKPPAGTKVFEAAGYVGLESYAAQYDRPGDGFGRLRDEGFRRAASVSWEEDDQLTKVWLLQFTGWRGGNAEAKSALKSVPAWAGNTGSGLPGLPPDAGHVWMYSKPSTAPGGNTVSHARAFVRRGDVFAEIFVYDRRGGALSESALVDLAKRQLERM